MKGNFLQVMVEDLLPLIFISFFAIDRRDRFLSMLEKENGEANKKMACLYKSTGYE
jgi:hypothetical protein